MVGYRNEKTRGHIVTIEDPVEYVHAHKGCVVTHREVASIARVGISLSRTRCARRRM